MGIMEKVIITILLVLLPLVPQGATTSVGLIQNASLIIRNTSAISFTGSLQQCLCQLLSGRSSVFSMNYFFNNQSCLLYLKSDQNKSFALISNGRSVLYFLSLPLQNLSISSTLELRWTFDSNSSISDLTQTFNGTLLNNATLSPSSIAGYGSSLSLIASLFQGVIIRNPFLNLVNQSWTFQLWIYLFDSPGFSDLAMIGQCDTTATRRCLHLNIRNSKIYYGFFGDDLISLQTFVQTTWYHIALVFDCSTVTQLIYINGFLDNNRTAQGCYQGSSGTLTFGILENAYSRAPFNGLIDRIIYANRTKTANEILRDATLTVYFSFNDNSIRDQGPFNMNASAHGNISLISSGRSGQALLIGNMSGSYLALKNLVLLGTSAQAYSISIWLRPNDLRQATIMHILSQDNNSSISSCLSLIGINSLGNVMTFASNGSLISIAGPVLRVNTWNHVVITYSVVNGLRLYVNGTRISTLPSSPFASIGSGVTNSVWVGSSGNKTMCASYPLVGGQYQGSIDELNVYSRELTTDDIFSLFNI